MEIGGISGNTASFDSIVNQIRLSINNASGNIFIHLNMQNFYFLRRNMNLLNNHKNSCRIFFEGIGMKLAFLIKNQAWINDTNGTDLFPMLFSYLSVNNCSVYLLGSTQSVINKTVQKLNNQFEGIKIAGYNMGYFGIENEIEITGNISESKPDLLIIGMGMEKEAEFINSNYNRLNVGAIWCVGGLFDFISGNHRRAPKIIRLIRLEWLFRFLIEPKTKFRRIFITPFWFYKCVLLEKLFNINNYKV